MNKVSAVILNWKRPYHMPTIVDSLGSHDFIDDIVVFDNSGGLDPVEGATVINSHRNMGTYGRYLAARHCRHDTIYTQDDDCLVHNIPALYERFQGHRGKITAGLSRGHYRKEAKTEPWIQLGWGSFFDRGWMDVIEQYICEYGSDELLHSKFDRIFTILYGEHDPVLADYTSLRGPDGRVSDRDQNSLWIQPQHGSWKELARKRALKLKFSDQEGV